MQANGTEGVEARLATDKLVSSRRLFFDLFGNVPNMVPEARIALDQDRQAVVEEYVRRYGAVAVRGIRKGSLPCRIVRDIGQLNELPRGEVILQAYVTAEEEINIHYQVTPSGLVREIGACDRQVVQPGVVRYRFPSEADGHDLSRAREKAMVVAAEYAKRGARGLLTVKTLIASNAEATVYISGISTQAPDRRLVSQKPPRPADLLVAEFEHGRFRREVEHCIQDLEPIGVQGVRLIAYDDRRSRGTVAVVARSVVERNRQTLDVMRRLRHVFSPQM